MILILIIFNILLSKEPFISHKLQLNDSNKILIEKITLGNENNALSTIKINNFNYILHSSNLGRSFDYIGKINYNIKNTKAINSVGYSGNKFILFLDDGLVYRINNDGTYLDTLSLPFRDYYMRINTNTFDSNYILAIGTRGPIHYDINNSSDTTLYNLYLSNDGFESYKLLNIEEIKNGNNLITFAKIVNNQIYFCISEARKIPNTNPIQYKNDYYLTSYNIKSNEYKVLYKQDYNIKGEYIEDIYITKKEDIFLTLGQLNNKDDTEYSNLYKLSDSNLEFIDTLYTGKKSSIKLIPYIDNDFILFYSFWSQLFKKVNTTNNKIDSVSFLYNYFKDEGEYSNIFYTTIWKDEKTNTYLTNIMKDVIYEFDLDYLFSMEPNYIPRKNIKTKSKIYPNPASESITISGIGKSKVEIYNILGQKVIEQDIFGKSEINISPLNGGIYIIKLTQDKETYVDRIIITD